MAGRQVGRRVTGLTPPAMWVDVDGGKLPVETAGRGSPLLLLHGWPLDHRIFEPQIRYLVRSFRVVVFDRRGFGRSAAPPDLGRELDDIDRIREALGLGPVHLLGMSQGARIALRYAVTRPRRIRSLILQAPAIDGVALDEPAAEQIPMEQFARLARAGRIEEVRRRWLAHPMMALDARDAASRRLVGEILGDYEGKDLLEYAPGRDGFPHDVLDGLAHLDVACLILTGAHDTVTRREHARMLLEAMPGARAVRFRDSGHLSNLTEAAAYNRQVADFCALVDGEPSREDAASGALRN